MRLPEQTWIDTALGDELRDPKKLQISNRRSELGDTVILMNLFELIVDMPSSTFPFLRFTQLSGLAAFSGCSSRKG